MGRVGRSSVDGTLGHRSRARRSASAPDERWSRRRTETDMRTDQSHEPGMPPAAPSVAAGAAAASRNRRAWVRPSVRIRPLTEVVRGAAGSAPDTFGQSANLPGG